MKVAIIGGGIGGMSLALSLVAAGLDDVDVYESAPAIRELGVGINVLPHAIRELTELGLLDQLSAVGIPTADFSYFSRLGQRIWGEPLGIAAGYQWPQVSIHRGQLLAVLYRAVIGPSRCPPHPHRASPRSRWARPTPRGVGARLSAARRVRPPNPRIDRAARPILFTSCGIPARAVRLRAEAWSHACPGRTTPRARIGGSFGRTGDRSPALRDSREGEVRQGVCAGAWLWVDDLPWTGSVWAAAVQFEPPRAMQLT